MSKFTIMPTKIFELGLDPAQIALFSAMCCKIDDNGFVASTYVELGELCGRSKPWVVENIIKLEANKFIKREKSSVRILYDGQYSDLMGQSTELIGQYTEPPLNSSNNINTTNKLSKRERKTKLPDNFHVTTSGLMWASKKRPDLDLDDITENFILYHKKMDSRFVDWQAAWKNWIKNERKNERTGNTNPHARSESNTNRGRKDIASAMDRRANRSSTD